MIIIIFKVVILEIEISLDESSCLNLVGGKCRSLIK